MWPLDQTATWLGIWGLLTVSYSPAKFDGHRYCGKAGISFLNFSRDHVIKTLCHFEGGVLQLQDTTLSSLVDIGIAEGQV